MKLDCDLGANVHTVPKGAFWNSYGQLLQCAEDKLSVYDGADDARMETD